MVTLRADKLGKQDKGATALPKVKERKEAVSEVGELGIKGPGSAHALPTSPKLAKIDQGRWLRHPQMSIK